MKSDNPDLSLTRCVRQIILSDRSNLAAVEQLTREVLEKLGDDRQHELATVLQAWAIDIAAIDGDDWERLSPMNRNLVDAALERVDWDGLAREFIAKYQAEHSGGDDAAAKIAALRQVIAGDADSVDPDLLDRLDIGARVDDHELLGYPDEDVARSRLAELLASYTGPVYRVDTHGTDGIASGAGWTDPDDARERLIQAAHDVLTERTGQRLATRPAPGEFPDWQSWAAAMFAKASERPGERQGWNLIGPPACGVGITVMPVHNPDRFEVFSEEPPVWIGAAIYTDEAIYIPIAMADGQVGYAVNSPSRDRQEFLYFNPSTGTDDGVPNVFVYQGPSGDPATDGPLHHYVVLEDDGAVESDRPAEPAYTVIGLYPDAETRFDAASPQYERFAETFFTHNGPKGAEALALEWARAQQDDPEAEIIVAGVVAGEVELADATQTGGDLD